MGGRPKRVPIGDGTMVTTADGQREQGIDPKILKTPMAELEEAAAKTVAAKKKAGDEEAKYSAVPEYLAVQHAQPHEYSIPSLGSAKEEKKKSWFRQALTPTQHLARMAVVGDVPIRVMMMGTKKDMAKLGSSTSSEEAANLGESPYVHHMRQRDAQLRDLNSNTIQSIERNIQSE